jgi:hypothetical protein
MDASWSRWSTRHLALLCISARYPKFHGIY